VTTTNAVPAHEQQAKRKPTGFVAICQCSLYVGALDFSRTDRSDAGRIMGRWLSDGCTVSPRFEGTWEVHIEPCQCGKQAGTTTTSKEP